MKYKCKKDFFDNRGILCFRNRKVYEFKLDTMAYSRKYLNICVSNEAGICHYLSNELLVEYFCPYREFKYGR